MKNPIIVLLVAACWTVLFSACTKNGVNPIGNQSGIIIGTSSNPQGNSSLITTATLSGKWTIALDSTWQNISNATYVKVSIDKYAGTPADYFEFTNDGKFYKHEKGITDTASYTIDASSIVISNSDSKISFTTTMPTSKSLILYYWFGGTLGAYYHTVILKKE